MFALLALIMGVLMVYAMWRLMDTSRSRDASPEPRVRAQRPRPARRSAPLPPDDNPDFLRELSSHLPARGSVPPADDVAEPTETDKREGGEPTPA